MEKIHDVKVLDILCEQGYIETAAFYVIDKAYVDFARLYTLHMAKAFFDCETGNTFEFLTNNLTLLPANTICAIYKQRWQVELFF